MNRNIIINFSPILALKTHYLDSCYMLTPESHYTEIPHIIITNRLTTTQEGFNVNSDYTWRITFFSDYQCWIVTVKSTKLNKYRSYLIKLKTTTILPSEGEIQSLENTDPPTALYPYYIPYDHNFNDYSAIRDIYVFNILSSTSWVDCMTPTKNNYDALNLAVSLGYTHGTISLKDDNVYNYIFNNQDLLPIPKYLVYRISNTLVGIEYLYRQVSLSNNITITVTKKSKVNEESEEE